jgi:hypothetical protein
VVSALVQLTGPDLRGGQVAVVGAVEDGEDLGAFGGGVRARRGGARAGFGSLFRAQAPVVGGLGASREPARRGDPEDGFYLIERFVKDVVGVGSVSALAESISSSACAEM